MPDSQKPSVSNLRRVVAIVGGAAVALLLAFLFLRKPFTWSMWIRDLTSDREARKNLRAETDPALIGKLESALSDTEYARDIRLNVGALLIEKENRAIVEKALTAASLDTRTIAIEVLARESFFRKQYFDDPVYRVPETLLEWMKDGARSDRVAAISILPVIYPYGEKPPAEVMAVVRAMASPSAPPSIRYNASASLAGYLDCESAGRILEMAGTEEDPEAKLRLMQIVVQQFWDAGNEECRGRMNEDAVRAVVVRALRHPGEGDMNRAVRIGALGLLARHPDWAKASVDVVRAILESNAHEVERRQALETLVAAADPKTVGRIPAWFHDGSAGVRSSASSAVGLDKGNGKFGLSQHALNALLAGYFSAETEIKGYEAPMRLAYAGIRQKAGVWVGLPEPFRTKGGAMNEVAEAVHKLLLTGSFEGTTRAQVADALFRWLAEQEKLPPADVEAAVKARGEFWKKALAGDAAGAKAVYGAAVGTSPDLWIYEKGWLMAKGAL